MQKKRPEHSNVPPSAFCLSKSSAAATLLRALLVLLCLLNTAGARQFEATVSAVKDGDSVMITRGGQALPVDLAGIDAPELGQAYGSEARAFLEQLLLHTKVTVHITGSAQATPIEAELYYLDGMMRSANKELIRNGLAWSKNRRTDSLESLAKRKRIGLWADAGTPIAPWRFREQEAAKRKAARELARKKKDAAFEKQFLNDYYRKQGQDRYGRTTTSAPANTIMKISSFNGVAWGSSIDSNSDMEYVEENREADQKHARETYRKKNESLRIAGVRLKHIYYYFYGKEFCAVELGYSSREDYQNLNGVLKEKYGRYKSFSADYTLWVLDDLSISTDWNDILQEGRAVIAHTPTMERLGITKIAP